MLLEDGYDHPNEVYRIPMNTNLCQGEFLSKKEDKDYDTSYLKNNGTESKILSDVAISSGSITIKNAEKMKFVLSETGGMGRNTIYALGILMIITVLFVA